MSDRDMAASGAGNAGAGPSSGMQGGGMADGADAVMTDAAGAALGGTLADDDGDTEDRLDPMAEEQAAMLGDDDGEDDRSADAGGAAGN